VHGRYVDNPAEGLLIHVRQRGAAQPEGRLQHHRDQPAELLRRELVQRRHILQSRAVDQHVGGASQRLGIKVRGCQVNLTGTTAHLAGDPRCRSQVDVGNNHVSPSLGQPDSAGRADPAAATRDHGGAPGQIVASRPGIRRG
jgi:hypothetical protein